MSLKMPPEPGDVYGLPFIFPGKTKPQVHPGLVFAVNVLSPSRAAVLALAISHKDTIRHEPALKVPQLERLAIGLDDQQQYVFYSFRAQFVLPGQASRIHGLDKTYIGRASDEFWKYARDAFLEYRRTNG